MNICIYGLGAVGGLIAGELANAGYKVSAIARGETLNTVKKQGLTLIREGHSQKYFIDVTEHPEEIGVQDLVIVTVKNTAIKDVASKISPLFSDNTTVLSAMNGVPWWFYHGLNQQNPPAYISSVDENGDISRMIPHERVVGCVSNLSSVVTAPGVIKYHPGPKFTIGEPTGGFSSQRCQAIMEAFSASGLDVTGSSQIQETIWFKLWGNMTVNPLTALTGVTADKLIADPLVREFMASCMEESRSVGRKIGLNIDATTESRFEATRKLGAFKPSMLQDVEAGKHLELDALVNAVREIASNSSIKTPNIDALFGICRLYAKNHNLY